MSGGSAGWAAFAVTGDDMAGGDVAGEFAGDRIAVMVSEERDGGTGVEELLMSGGWGAALCALAAGSIRSKSNSCMGTPQPGLLPTLNQGLITGVRDSTES